MFHGFPEADCGITSNCRYPKGVSVVDVPAAQLGELLVKKSFGIKSHNIFQVNRRLKKPETPCDLEKLDLRWRDKAKRPECK